MKTEIFNFDLPIEAIANEPAHPRDSSRLMHILPDGSCAHHFMRELDELLRPGDVLVFNDTKVIPARLYGMRGAAKIEVTLFKHLGESVWETLIKNARRLKENDIIHFGHDFTACVQSKTPQGHVILEFNKAGSDLRTAFHKNGVMPLPPYIKRGPQHQESDKKNYQTIYARNEGAVAAPTAGLHFTP
ncbi:MAG: S-adenosylmethionine:tRNA ribosyltransferase-isomerase, partial [Lactobacillales bacterium]|nr:S-adenosylmethionine:tRNA ribosyltransferase-isomerase [Lactobacillales bacterium]